MVGLQAIQNLLQMKNVVNHCGTINKNIIKKKNNHKFFKGEKILFMVAWKVDGTLVKPNGMIENS